MSYSHGLGRGGGGRHGGHRGGGRRGWGGRGWGRGLWSSGWGPGFIDYYSYNPCMECWGQPPALFRQCMAYYGCMV